jgi:Uma2 family endonuclease
MSVEPVEHADPIAAHEGPWTEADYFALEQHDVAENSELIDGELVMTPHADSEHQLLEFRLCREFEAQLPDSVIAIPEPNVRLAYGRVVGPDVVITSNLARVNVLDAHDVLLLAEVVSPTGKARDRIFKPALYAEAGVPWYLRVERDPDLELILFRENDGVYEEQGRAQRGGRLTIPELDVTLEVDALLRRR